MTNGRVLSAKWKDFMAILGYNDEGLINPIGWRSHKDDAVIRLQRIYNFLLFHAILYSVLDIIGIYYTLYIIFGTNLLTGGPAQNCCFFAYFRVSRKKNIKRSPNRMKPSGT